MIQEIIYYRIVGIVLIGIGCLFLTRKKFIINRLYSMIFWCTVIFGGKAIDPLGRMFVNPYGFGGTIIDPISTNLYLSLVATFYSLCLIISYLTVKGRYEITNVNGELVMTAITSLLDEKRIAYEVIGESVVLTNYDYKEIKCGGFLKSTEINFRGIRKLSFYHDVKEGIFSRVKEIKETVFPGWGLIYIIFGLVLLVAGQFELTPKS